MADNSSREPPVPSFGIFQDRTVLKLVEQAKGRKMWVQNPNITAMVTDWDCTRNNSVPGYERTDLGAFRTMFAVYKKSVILFQSCIRMDGLKKASDTPFSPAVWKAQDDMMRSGLFTPLEVLQMLNSFTRRFETCPQVTIGIEWAIRISDLPESVRAYYSNWLDLPQGSSRLGGIIIRAPSEARAALEVVQRSRQLGDCLHECSMTLVKRTPNAEWKPVHSATWGPQFTFPDWLKEEL